MSAVATLSYVPSIIDSGETVRFTTSDSDYPSDAWTMAFVLNNGVNAPLSVAATANGLGYTVAITATQTAALAPGPYTWAEVFTAISPTSEKAYGTMGTLEVLPNIATTITPSVAQAQVTLLESVLAGFGTNTYVSVSFNGQSFQRGEISTYRNQLVYWKAMLIAEKRRIASLRGTYSGGHIPVRFVQGLPEETCP